MNAPSSKSVVERFGYVFQSVKYLADEMVMAGVTKRALQNQTGVHVLLGLVVSKFEQAGLDVGAVQKLQAMNADFAPFAKREVENGYHTVHLHALINMWGVTYNAITHTVTEQISSSRVAQRNVCEALNDKKNAINTLDWGEAESLAGRLIRKQLRTLSAEAAFPAAASIAGVVFDCEKDMSSLEEARLARNAYVHGDGTIGIYEAGRVGSLKQYLGQKFSLSEETGQRYNDSMSNFIVNLGASILASIK